MKREEYISDETVVKCVNAAVKIGTKMRKGRYSERIAKKA